MFRHGNHMIGAQSCWDFGLSDTAKGSSKIYVGHFGPFLTTYPQKDGLNKTTRDKF